MAGHCAVLDALLQVVADQLARVGFLLEARPQQRRFEVGAMAGLLRPGPRRVVRPAPAVLVRARQSPDRLSVRQLLEERQ